MPIYMNTPSELFALKDQMLHALPFPTQCWVKQQAAQIATTPPITWESQIGQAARLRSQSFQSGPQDGQPGPTSSPWATKKDNKPSLEMLLLAETIAAQAVQRLSAIFRENYNPTMPIRKTGSQG